MLDDNIYRNLNIGNTPNLGLSVMLLSGAEVAATSVPDKSMTLIPKLAVIYRIEIALDHIR